jgi:cell division protein FtsI/penicillin-binding protein 2
VTIVRWRLVAVALLLVVGALGIVARLAKLQLLDYEDYRAVARTTHQGEQALQAQRGAIRDRNGFPLAVSVPAYRVAVHPKAWPSPEAAQRVRTIVADHLKLPVERLEAMTAQSDLSLFNQASPTTWVALSRNWRSPALRQRS